eukprot:6188722-Pleurochrysis_carterae.AAC.1
MVVGDNFSLSRAPAGVAIVRAWRARERVYPYPWSSALPTGSACRDPPQPASTGKITYASKLTTHTAITRDAGQAIFKCP